MKNIVFLAVALVWLGLVAAAQQPAKPLYVLEDSYLKWRLLPSEQAYLSIDGKHLKQYVEELTAISRRYRDHGHLQFWGRITGTEADAENANGSPTSSARSVSPMSASNPWICRRSGCPPRGL